MPEHGGVLVKRHCHSYDFGERLHEGLHLLRRTNGKTYRTGFVGTPSSRRRRCKMGLRHCVLTSVARDDLKDGGAKVWAATIRAVRYRNPSTAIEVLVPDFKGNFENLDLVLDANPDIFNHNLETVERLQRPIRKTASYQRSLDRPCSFEESWLPHQVRNHVGIGRKAGGDPPSH